MLVYNNQDKQKICMETVTRQYLFHYEHPELTLPRCSSLVLAGTALYLGFIRPLAMKEKQVGKEHTAHCAEVAHVNKCAINTMAGISGILGLNAYRLTKQLHWLYGGLAALAIIPLSCLCTDLSCSKKQVDQKQGVRVVQHERGVWHKMGSWIWRHRIQAVLAFTAAGFFYCAQTKFEFPSNVRYVLVNK